MSKQVANKSQLDHQGKDLVSRLKRFTSDFEDNPRISESEKERQWKALEADNKAWEADMDRHQSDMRIGDKIINAAGASSLILRSK